MPAPQEFRDRDDVEVAILDALVTRSEDGMTVFELRSHVDEDIETLEEALSRLHRDGLISVQHGDSRSVILPADHVVPPDADEDSDGAFVESIRRRLRRIRRLTRR